MKTFIIAEIGINHNGSLDRAKEMIRASAEAGCDAVKFQFFSTKFLYPQSAGNIDWKDDKKEYSYDIYEANSRYEIPESWIDDLIKYSKECGIEWFASVFDSESLNLGINKGMKKIKIASSLVTHIPFIEECAKTELPIYISTGGATLGEVEQAIETINLYHNHITLMHCTLSYPTLSSDCNLGVLETFQKAFPGIAIGYSDHTSEISEAPVQAVYLGAKVIEKHITFDRGAPGPDHFFALNSIELRQMVADIRRAESVKVSSKFIIDHTIYGTSRKIILESEKKLRDFVYPVLFAKRDIKKGETITEDDISILRPGKKQHGLPPRMLKLFQNNVITAKKNIQFEDPIEWDRII